MYTYNTLYVCVHVYVYMYGSVYDENEGYKHARTHINVHERVQSIRRVRRRVVETTACQSQQKINTRGRRRRWRRWRRPRSCPSRSTSGGWLHGVRRLHLSAVARDRHSDGPLSRDARAPGYAGVTESEQRRGSSSTLCPLAAAAPAARAIYTRATRSVPCPSPSSRHAAAGSWRSPRERDHAAVIDGDAARRGSRSLRGLRAAHGTRLAPARNRRNRRRTSTLDRARPRTSGAHYQ